MRIGRLKRPRQQMGALMQQRRIHAATGRRLATAALAVVLMASVSGCGTDKMKTGSIGRSGDGAIATMSTGQLRSASARLGKAYAANPDDKATAI